jgi:hypothetical protein
MTHPLLWWASVLRRSWRFLDILSKRIRDRELATELRYIQRRQRKENDGEH